MNGRKHPAEMTREEMIEEIFFLRTRIGGQKVLLAQYRALVIRGREAVGAAVFAANIAVEALKMKYVKTRAQLDAEERRIGAGDLDT